MKRNDCASAVAKFNIAENAEQTVINGGFCGQKKYFFLPRTVATFLTRMGFSASQVRVGDAEKKLNETWYRRRGR